MTSKPSTSWTPRRPRSSPLPPETLPPTACCPQLHLLFSTRHLPPTPGCGVSSWAGGGLPGCLAVRAGGRPGFLPLAQPLGLLPFVPRGHPAPDGVGGESGSIIYQLQPFLPPLPGTQSTAPLPPPPVTPLSAMGGAQRLLPASGFGGGCDPATEPQTVSVQSAKG